MVSTNLNGEDHYLLGLPEVEFNLWLLETSDATNRGLARNKFLFGGVDIDFWLIFMHFKVFRTRMHSFQGGLNPENKP